ncbi:universal stress protein [Ktedonosporobacter rubrisoli]|uniref:Universal stress protein n=1 Tax=Ktedonosporobacter rubrisoli TaxID=2509675 RepID=A0A4P6K0V3_KTERU|nr:universal stress protein [Ktedonosporobacter rubrisoli]QBD81432.1 universal stress protein [Ktedonosporobacter rubrisoli]
MNKRILLGVDADLSLTTQQALCMIGEFIEQAAPHSHLILLNVIPSVQVVATHPGLYVGQVLPAVAPATQRGQAEDVLRKARIILQKQGIELPYTECIVRSGAPADEIVRAARELHVSFIVVGSHGESFKQRFRRIFTGSISHRVLQLAPCPVMVVAPPNIAQPDNLVAWYEDAIKHYLNENTDALAVFTPEQVAKRFAPSNKNTPGHKELQAASRALEQLAQSGRLCRHQVKGELRYVND